MNDSENRAAGADAAAGQRRSPGRERLTEYLLGICLLALCVLGIMSFLEDGPWVFGDTFYAVEVTLMAIAAAPVAWLTGSTSGNETRSRQGPSFFLNPAPASPREGGLRRWGIV